MDSDLKKLLASTFIGGSKDERVGQSFKLSLKDEKVYVTGFTWSEDFPTTPAVYDKIYSGEQDCYISVFDINLKNLIASTLIGGESGDFVYCMTLDEKGNVFIGGHAGADYPTTHGAFREVCKSMPDVAFLTKFSSDLKTVYASTFIGGSVAGGGGGRVPLCLEADDEGDIFVSGWTNAADFPVTPGAYDETFNGESDTFILTINNNLSRISALTYIGGTKGERWNNFVFDNNKDIYLTAYTFSPDFPTTEGTFQEKFAGGESDAFIAKISKNLSSGELSKVHEAAKKDDDKKLERIIRDKSDLVNKEDKYKRTPLHWAARYGSERVFKSLIKKRVEINPVDEHGNTPLHLAAKFNFFNILRELLAKGADVNLTDKNGNTPLHLASICESVESAEILLSKNVMINSVNKEGNTPLHLGVFYHCTVLTDLLLKKGADMNLKNKNGDTPLHLASKGRKNLKCIKLLLNAGSDINSRDNESKTPLIAAIDGWSKANAELLISSGADIKTKDNNNRTALHYSATKGLYLKVITENLIAGGVDINAKDKDGKTPLDLAKEGNHTEIVELLEKKGAK